MRDLIVLVAGGFDWHQNRKSLFASAARKSGLSYRTVRGIWYGEYSENAAPVRALRAKADLIEARKSAALLASRCAQAASAMDAADPDFYGTFAALLRRAVAEHQSKVNGRTNGHGDPNGAGTDPDSRVKE